MKLLLTYIALAALFTSCNSNLLVAEYHDNSLTLDAKDNVYASEKIIMGEVDDFEIKARIKFLKSYRDDNTKWAGFFIKTDNSQGLHREDSGYLCYIRSNGEIGIHSSPPPDYEIILKKNIKLNTKRYTNIKIVSKDAGIQFFVNNKKILETSYLLKTGNYIAANVGGCAAQFDLKSIKHK